MLEYGTMLVTMGAYVLRVNCEVQCSVENILGENSWFLKFENSGCTRMISYKIKKRQKKMSVCYGFHSSLISEHNNHFLMLIF